MPNSPLAVRAADGCSRAHPHDLKTSDIQFIASYLGDDPSRFDDAKAQELKIGGICANE